MKIEDILEEWGTEDAHYSDDDIAAEFLKLPQLHQKYQQYLNAYEAKAMIKRQEVDRVYAELFHYYRGRGADDKGRGYEHRITSQSEVAIYIKADPKYAKAAAAQEAAEISLRRIREIMDQIKARGFNLGHLKDWKIFTSGG